MPYFLAKTDPETYSLDDLEREKKTVWDGVTNPQAVRAIHLNMLGFRPRSGPTTPEEVAWAERGQHGYALDLSRLDAEAVATDPRPLVLRTVLADIVSATVADPRTVQLEVPDDLAGVVDPLVLERVVSNLLLNATRYGEAPIVVSAEQRDRHLRVAVEDSGSGIAEELQPQLFDRFVRGGEAGGSGLGLAIARAYARAAGGDLLYQPRRRGARFELIVPQG